MVTFVSRAVGVTVVLGLSVVGASTVFGKIMTWKDAHDRFQKADTASNVTTFRSKAA